MKQRALFILLAASSAQCKTAAKELPSTSAIELAGCKELARGPICEADPGTALALWIAGDAPARLALDGAPITAASTATTAGGARYSFTLDRRARELSVSIARGTETEVWRHALAPASTHAALEEAGAKKRAGDYAGAEAILAAHEGELIGPLEVAALGLRGRLALAKGEHQTALDLLARAADRAGALGLSSRVCDENLVRAYVLTWFLRRFDEARAALHTAEEAAEPSYPKGRANVPYYAGLLARETGDLRGALRLFAIAEERAERLGLDDLRSSVRQTRANTLVELGRIDAALAILAAVEGTQQQRGAGACERADLHANIGWDLLRAHELERAETTLQDALAGYTGGCPQPARALTVRVSLALAALERGDAAAASRRLQEARDTKPTLDVFLWQLDLEGRIALARGHAKDALAAYRRLEKLGEASFSSDAIFRAALGEARAHVEEKAFERAIEAYRRAEAVLDDRSLRVPLGHGRDSFLAEHEASARELVALLVQRGDARGALSAARIARARLLERLSVEHRVQVLSAKERARWDEAMSSYRHEREALDREAEDDWKLPLDLVERARAARREREAKLHDALDRALALVASPRTETLREPEDGELLLAFFPAPRPASWIGFAADRHAVIAKDLGPLAPALPRAPPAILAAQLLDPFREAIERARRIRVLPHGAMQAIDVHALPFHGKPLIAAKPIAYGLDLAPAVTASTAPSVRRALIVADARGDLLQARREAELAEKLLRAQGLAVEMLEGEAAEADAVRSALGRAALFHYAGHGVFAGVEGLESALQLAHGTELSAGDILVLPRVPRLVVLSGCETARASIAGAESAGVAQAFVAAGAEAVIAASRPVGDALARELATNLHRGAIADPAESLRAAVLPMIASGDRDWAAFRALLP